MEEKPLEQKVKNEKIESKKNIGVLLEKIEPDKWYGICYGRELDKEWGKFYQWERKVTGKII